MVPVDEPHFLFASDGAAAVEQALKIAFQYWANRGDAGRTTFLAFGGAYHGDTIGALSVGDGGFGTELFDPLRFPVLRAPPFTDPACFDTACALVAEHAAELAAVIVEPLVQGAAGMQLADPDGLRALGAACRAHDVLLICDEVATGFGRTGTLFASEQCGLRPDLLVLGKGLTAGYLPDVGDGGERARVRCVPRPRPRRRGRSTTVTPTRGTHWRPRSRCATSSCSTHGRCSTTCATRSDELRGAARRPRSRPRPAVARSACCGLMGGVELAPPADGLRWGRRVSRGGRRPRRAAPPARRRRRAHAAAHRHVGGAAPHRARARRRARRGDDVTGRPTCDWDAWADRAEARADRRRRADGARPARFDRADRRHRRRSASCRSPQTTTSASRSIPRSVAAAHDAIDRWGTGAGAARLIVGSRPVHHELEAELADWKGTEAAVLFSTGFAANLGVLGAFAGPDTLVCSDELNHASLIDGRRLAGAPLAVYRHCDAAHVDELLARQPSIAERSS